MIVLIPATVLSGCTDPANFETTPVDVETSRGTVTCQLYAPNVVTWDQAVLAPEGMSIPEADKVCQTEGLRRIEES
jgi:hypothetical protein